ncbi:MAG: S8 family serine peptidase [Elusimicrobia bacterium]|nr:S8 family serine peptidase [Elusimicrobiota bacterium]
MKTPDCKIFFLVSLMFSAVVWGVEDPSVSKGGSDIIPGRFLIKIKPGAKSPGSLEDLHRKFKAKKFKKIIPGLENKTSDDSARETRTRFPLRSLRAQGKADPVGIGLDRIYVLEVPSDTDSQEILKAYRENSAVEYIEPDALVHVQATLPNDPWFGDLWGLHNVGQSSGTVDADIDAPEVWDVVTGATSPIVVGVVDTGVDYTHPELSGHIWTNPREIPGNGIDDDGNGYVDDVRGWDFKYHDKDPMDDHGHGTHVSGTIAASGNNGQGVVGVTWGAKIMPLKFLGYDGSGDAADAVVAIYYAAANGADVLNNSWGGGGYSQTLQDAINYARALGVFFVASAGNSGSDAYNTYPAAMDNVFTVAATDRNDLKASFSSYGSVVDISAPGVSILSTVPPGPCALCDPSGDIYRYLSGTSMASPHVSGVAALMLTQAPSLSVSELESLLKNSAEDIYSKNPGYVGLLGAGRLNAYRAVVSQLSGVFVSKININDDSTPPSNGDGDGRWESQETIELNLAIKNMTPENIVGGTGQITTSDPYVTLLQASANFGDLVTGEEKFSQAPFALRVNVPPEDYPVIPLKLQIQDSMGRVWSWDLSLPVSQPRLFVLSTGVKDNNTGQSSGNGNGVAEPGETIEYQVIFKNEGLGDARGVNVTLSGNPAEISFLQGQAFLGDISQSGGTSTGTFVLNLPTTVTRPGSVHLDLNISMTAGARHLESDLIRSIKIEKIYQATAPAFGYPFPSVSRSQVAWQRLLNSNPPYQYDVMVYDIPTRTTRVVHQYKEDYNWVWYDYRMMQINQGKIAYLKIDNAPGGKFLSSAWLFDTQTNQIQQMGSLNYKALELRFSTEGDYVAWQTLAYTSTTTMNIISIFDVGGNQLRNFTLPIGLKFIDRIMGFSCGRLVARGSMSMGTDYGILKLDIPSWQLSAAQQWFHNLGDNDSVPSPMSADINCANHLYMDTWLYNTANVYDIWDKDLNSGGLNLAFTSERRKYPIQASQRFISWGDTFDYSKVILYDLSSGQKTPLTYSLQDKLMENNLHMDDGHIVWATMDGASNMSIYLATFLETGDKEAPSVYITSPGDGASVSASSSVVVTARAYDNVGVAGVQFYLDGANLGAEDTTPPYSALWDTSRTSSGTHTLTAVARDAAGNQMTAGIVTVVQMSPDITPPSVSITYPPDGSVFLSPQTLTVSVSAFDDIVRAGDRNLGISKVELYLDSFLVGTRTASPYDFSEYFSTGTHTVMAKAYDTSNNTSTHTITVTMQNIKPPAAPTVAILSPANGASVSGTIVLSGTASGDPALSRVEIQVDGGTAQTASGTSSWSFLLNTLSLSNGNHSILARAIDTSFKTVSSSISISVVNGDTTAPIASIVSPANGSNIKVNTTVSVSCSDNIAVQRVDLYADGFLAGSQTFSPPTTPCSANITWHASTYGTHTLQAKAVDTSGNVGSSSLITVTVVKGNVGMVSLVTTGSINPLAPQEGEARALMVSPQKDANQTLVFDESVEEVQVLTLSGKILVEKHKQGSVIVIPVQSERFNLESGFYMVQMLAGGERRVQSLLVAK